MIADFNMFLFLVLSLLREIILLFFVIMILIKGSRVPGFYTALIKGYVLTKYLIELSHLLSPCDLLTGYKNN